MAAAGFSVTDAAFTGFRVVWRQPLAVLYWAALRFAVALAATLFITLSAGAQFARVAEALWRMDEATLDAHWAGAAPTFAVLAVGSLVVDAVISAAMNRAVLRPEQSRFGYLRLAGDELRQLGLLAMMAILAMALIFGMAAVAAFIFALLGFAGGPGVMLLAFVILIPLFIVLIVFAAVRFSLASAQTFASGRIDLFGSWAMTRGRFWPLLLSYGLALAMRLVVEALTFAISLFAVALLQGGGGDVLDGGAGPDFSSLAAAFTPVSVALLAIEALRAGLGLPITLTPPAAIYRALTGGDAGSS
jgi:hypothetical protein